MPVKSIVLVLFSLGLLSFFSLLFPKTAIASCAIEAQDTGCSVFYENSSCGCNDVPGANPPYTWCDNIERMYFECPAGEYAGRRTSYMCTLWDNACGGGGGGGACEDLNCETAKVPGSAGTSSSCYDYGLDGQVTIDDDNNVTIAFSCSHTWGYDLRDSGEQFNSGLKVRKQLGDGSWTTVGEGILNNESTMTYQDTDPDIRYTGANYRVYPKCDDFRGFCYRTPELESLPPPACTFLSVTPASILSHSCEASAVTASGQDGEGTLTYSFYSSGGSYSGSGASRTYTSDATGTYNLWFNVTDSRGATAWDVGTPVGDIPSACKALMTVTSKPDDVPPPAPNANDPTCSNFNQSTNEVTFNWNWAGDNTCSEACCEPAVGEHPTIPYWWQIGDADSTLATGYQSGLTTKTVSCNNSISETLRLDVMGRDANSNIANSSESSYVGRSYFTCAEDSGAPIAPNANGTFYSGAYAIEFDWSWVGDTSGSTCEESKVGYCTSGGTTSSTGLNCDPNVNPPFTVSVVDATTGASKYSYSGAGTQSGNIPCDSVEQIMEATVTARDARGNTSQTVVTEACDNDAPICAVVIPPSGVANIEMGTDYTLTFNMNDADNEELDYYFNASFGAFTPGSSCTTSWGCSVVTSNTNVSITYDNTPGAVSSPQITLYVKDAKEVETSCSATLNITDSNPCVSSCTVSPPSATVAESGTIEFDVNLVSTVQGGTPILGSINWIASNGSFSSTTTRPTTYTAPAATGNYTVGAQILDTCSNSVTCTGDAGVAGAAVTVTDTPVAPTCDNSQISLSDTDSPYAEGTPINITAHGEDVNGGVLTYNWNSVSLGSLNTQTGQTVTYTTGACGGSELVGYTVTDTTGLTSSTCGVTITTDSCAQFSCTAGASPSQIQEWETTTLSASGQNGSGNYSYLSWVELGTGTVSPTTGQSVTYTPAAGSSETSQSVRASVRDNDTSQTVTCDASVAINAAGSPLPYVQGQIYYDFNDDGDPQNWCHVDVRYETPDSSGYFGLCRNYSPDCTITDCVNITPPGYFGGNVDMDNTVLTADYDGQTYAENAPGNASFYSFYFPENSAYSIAVDLTGETGYVVKPSSVISGVTGAKGTTITRNIGVYKADDVAPTCTGVSPSVTLAPGDIQTFTAVASDANEDFLTYTWNVSPAVGTPTSSSGGTNTFTWFAPDEEMDGISISATVSDGTTSVDCPVAIVDVTNEAPTCLITAPPDESTYDPFVNVGFIATVSDSDQDTLSYIWSASSGNFVSAISGSKAYEYSDVTATYTMPGTYGQSAQVTLTVTDPTGETGTCTHTINTPTNSAPVCTTINSDVTLGPLDTYIFTAVASDLDGDPLIYTWNVTAGAPTYQVGVLSTLDWTAPGYEEDGVIVSATVSDGNGNSALCPDATVNIRNSLPTCNISSPASGSTYMPAESVPIAGTIDDVDSDILSYNWSTTLGISPSPSDGSRSSPYTNVDAIYVMPDDYEVSPQVTLTVNDPLPSTAICAIILNTPSYGSIEVTASLTGDDCIADLGVLEGVDVAVSYGLTTIGTQTTSGTGIVTFGNLEYGTYLVSATKDQYISCTGDQSTTLSIGDADKSLSFKFYEIQPRGWITVTQGNAIVNSAYNSRMPAGKDVIVEKGTLIVDGAVDLLDGSLGDTAYQLADYPYEGYTIALLFDHYNSSTGDIEYITGNHTIDNTNLPSKKYLMVDGNLTVNKEVQLINTTLIVSGNVVIESIASFVGGPSDFDLTIHGELWVKGYVSNYRDSELNVESDHSYIDDSAFSDFSSERLYTISFD